MNSVLRQDLHASPIHAMAFRPARTGRMASRRNLPSTLMTATLLSFTMPRKWPTLPHATLIAVGSGLVWRTVRYALAFPLWGDEAYVAINLITRDFAGLARPLEYSRSRCQASSGPNGSRSRSWEPANGRCDWSRIWRAWRRSCCSGDSVAKSPAAGPCCWQSPCWPRRSIRFVIPPK